MVGCPLAGSFEIGAAASAGDVAPEKAYSAAQLLCLPIAGLCVP